MFGPESCSGVVNCALGEIQDDGFSLSVVHQCAATGTKDAGALFGTLFTCAQGCVGSANLSGCLANDTAAPDADAGIPDGGPCFPEYAACVAQGQGCGTVFNCIEQAELAGHQSEVPSCIGEGTMTAINLSENVVGCVQDTCADAGSGAQACGAAALSAPSAQLPDGGACYGPLVQCESDTSAMP
jgi:hypothetical protein